jgi:hypothetical protein
VERITSTDGRSDLPVADVATADRRPAAMCAGPAHVIVYGNAAFVSSYGRHSLGLPAREAMLDLPPSGFAVLDAVLRRGRPFARWILRGGGDWRLTVAPRIDPDGDVYGVSLHLRARSDVPIRSA